MSTRHVIAAVSSVAILCSTIAIFQVSSHPRVYPFDSANPKVMVDSRPVHELDPVVVRATPLPPESAGAFVAPFANARSGFALPSLDNTSYKAGTPLFMPYYSFANDLHGMIKD